MDKFMIAVLAGGLISISSCTKDRAPLHEHSPSCDLPPQRRPMARFLPGSDCPTVQSVPEHMMLPLEAKLQQCELWCWSAVVSTLASYNGAAFQSCEIASMGTGQACCVMDPCAKPECNKTLPSADVAPLLDKIGISAERLERALTEHELKQEIASGRPVLIVKVSGNRDQHMLVAYGYDHVQFSVLDPAPGGWHGTTGYEILRGDPDGLWHWSETWRIRSKQPGSCPTQ